MLLDRSGQGKVYQLISRRRFQQMEVLEGQNILVTVSGKKNRVRVYYLSWLKSKILRTEGVGDQNIEKRNGWINVGDLQGSVHFKIVKYEKIKFLVIALRDSIEIYAWAPRPYHKFMAFKVCSFDTIWLSYLCVVVAARLTFNPVSLIVFWRLGSSSSASRFDYRRRNSSQSHLWISRRIPCHRSGSKLSLRYLYP